MPPLEKVKIPVLFSGGLDQKTHEHLTIPGKFKRLQNVIRRKLGEVRKRFGFTEITKDGIPGSNTLPISAPYKVTTFKDEIAILANKKIYTYSPTRNRWNETTERSLIPVQISEIPLEAYEADSFTGYDLASLHFITRAVHGGGYIAMTLALVSDSGGGSGSTYYFDLVTSDKLRRASGDLAGFYGVFNETSQGVLGITYSTAISRFVAFGINNPAAISTQRVNSATPESQVNPSGVQVTGLPDSSNIADGRAVTYDADSAYIAYIYDNLTLRVAKVTLSTLAASVVGTHVITSTGTAQSVEDLQFNPANGDVYVTYADRFDRANPKTIAFNTTMTNKSAEYSNVSYNGRKHRGVFTNGKYFVYSESTADTAINQRNFVWSGIDGAALTVQNSGAVIDSNYTPRMVAVFAYDNDPYCLAYPEGVADIDKPYLLVTSGTGNSFLSLVVGKMYEGYFPDYIAFCEQVAIVGSKVYIPLSVRGRVDNITAAGDVTGSTAMVLVTIDFDSAKAQIVSTPDRLFISGGILWEYDGLSVYENNFLMAPTVDVTNSAIVPLAAGTYSVTCILEAVDDTGTIHRSSPSIPKTIVSTGVTAYRLTATTFGEGFKNKRNGVRYKFYATQNGGTIFYLISNGSSIKDFQFAPDGTTEILYTQSGVLENRHPEGIRAMTLHKGRLFFSHLIRSLAYSYTKFKTVNESFGWSDENVSAEPIEGGPFSAFASLDEKLICFHEDRIRYLTGDGPEDTGANNDYRQLALLPATVGCTEPASVVVVPQGVMFKSRKGIYLLDRSLNTVYVGKDVADYNNEEITSAVLMSDEDEVRFTTRAGNCLVYNYLFDQWSEFTNYNAPGAALTGLNEYWHVKTSDSIPRKESAAYQDGSSNIQMIIETSWLAFDSLQGFQRVYAIEILGELLSAHSLEVDIAYDYNSNYTQTVTFSSASIAAGAPLKYRIRPQIQKCEAIKLRIKDQSNSGAALKLTGITFEVARKVGLNKIRSEQSE